MGIGDEMMAAPIVVALLYILPIDLSIYQLEMETGCSVTISSGYRTVTHNKKVGGVKNSFHLTDRARDVIPKCNHRMWAEKACKYVSVIQYKGHVHVDNREKDKLCKIIKKKRKKRE